MKKFPLFSFVFSKMRLPIGLFLLLPLFSFGQSTLTREHLFDTVPFLTDHYAQRVKEFAEQPVVPGRIIFLGNSITEMGNWAQLLGDSTVINRGIGGDVTYGVLERLQDIIIRKPSKVFLLIGINDIGKDIPVRVIADNIRKIITRIKAGSPPTRIYLQSVLPVNPTVQGFPQHYNKESQVIALNKLLKVLALRVKCRFVNLFPLFLDKHQRMNKKYTIEGLHLLPAGYQVWIKYLRKTGCL
ncbi:MAG: GDSL-type esterase/lipase family protein [Chitinophagaceae bacterium]